MTLDNVYKAGYALRNVVRKTDVIYAPKLRPDAELYLKTENLQITGSFKVRGAYYKMSKLSEEEKARGVIACSAGNHAQGVALAAQKNGIKAVICLPDGAPISKVERQRATVPRYALSRAFMMTHTKRLSSFVTRRDIHSFTPSMTRMLSQVRERLHLR